MTLLFAVLCGISGLTAQNGALMETGWTEARNDSVAPWVGFSIPLYGEYTDTVYSVDIEFPELLPLPDDVASRWNLKIDSVPRWPQVDLFIGVSHGKAALDAGFLPVIERNGRLMVINSFKPVLRREPVSMERKSAGRNLMSASDRLERYSDRSVLAQGRWVKIRIQESGIYKLTYSSLRSMGFTDPSKVRLFGYGGAVLPETDLQDLVDDLPEQPLWNADGSLLFYAAGPVSWEMNFKGEYVHKRNTYSEYGYYFLTDNVEGEPALFNQAPTDSITGTLIDVYPDFTLYDPDRFSWYRSGRRFFENYDYAYGNSRVYPFRLDGIIPDSVLMTVGFSTDCDVGSRLTVYVNGSEAGAVNLGIKGYNDVAYVADRSLMVNNLFDEKTDVKLVHEREGNPSGRLDYIRLNFKRRLAMYGSHTVFRTGADRQDVSFKISGSSPGVRIWKISSDGTVSTVPSVYSDGISVTQASDYEETDLLIAVNVNGDFPEPETVGVIDNQDLHALKDIEMVILVPASGKLTVQAERLAEAHRVIDSLTVAVVRADMIYNEFSSGTPDATAIRRFMKMLYDRAGNGGTPPRYLLLMGDGAWDNRMLVSDWQGKNPDDYLLCYESYNSTSHLASYVMEDYYGLLDDSEGHSLLREKVDLGIGRLPVQTAIQAEKAVDRIIDYMSGKNGGAWRNRIIFLGDDGDNNTHMRDADESADIYRDLYPQLDQVKIYWDAYKMEINPSYSGYPSVRRQILEELDRGALVVNYIGHGSGDVLSHELVLNKKDAVTLTSPRLPFWITASCDIAPFDAPLESFGMNLIKNEKGGAIGVLSTTRTVLASHNRLMTSSFSKYILSYGDDGVQNSVGDALRLTKNELVTPSGEYTDYSVNKIHYVLLGDPALKLGMARMTAVLDSFSHKPASADSLMAMAGSVIEVQGHIEADGVIDNNFSGKLFASVYDSEREVICLNNAKAATTPFRFMYRDRILYSGTDSVRNGRFTFSFPVPLDINYSGEPGRISLYASEEEGKRAASGFFENFLVGGTNSLMKTDTVGPKVSLYLNTPSFRFGGAVNSTPVLVADISDESGINTSGNGLGHDMLLMIDNDPGYTWVLNGYFTSKAGDYTGGRVVFNLPPLPEGKHRLMLRVWDVMNNSTVAYLDFKVVEGLKPKFELHTTPNPAKQATTFVVTHDRPGQDALVTVQVYDSGGVLQWTGTTVDTTDSGVSMIPWNLVGSSGRRMQPGLYIIRATVETPGQSEEGKALTEKLVILGR